MSNEIFDDRDRDKFFELPYAGNHIDLGKIDQWNTLAVFNDGTDKWYFTHDESWDNVDYAGRNVTRKTIDKWLSNYEA
jgi:hypothetical protein